MRNNGIQKFLACFSIFAFLSTLIAPIFNISAECTKGISKKEYAEQLSRYENNLDEFKKLNKKIRKKDLSKIFSKLIKVKDIGLPALSAIIYMVIVLSNKEEKFTYKEFLKHSVITLGVAIFSNVSNQLSSQLIDSFISE